MKSSLQDDENDQIIDQLSEHQPQNDPNLFEEGALGTPGADPDILHDKLETKS